MGEVCRSRLRGKAAERTDFRGKSVSVGGEADGGQIPEGESALRPPL